MTRFLGLIFPEYSRCYCSIVQVLNQFVQVTGPEDSRSEWCCPWRLVFAANQFQMVRIVSLFGLLIVHKRFPLLVIKLWTYDYIYLYSHWFYCMSLHIDLFYLLLYRKILDVNSINIYVDISTFSIKILQNCRVCSANLWCFLFLTTWHSGIHFSHVVVFL